MWPSQGYAPATPVTGVAHRAGTGWDGAEMAPSEAEKTQALPSNGTKLIIKQNFVTSCVKSSQQCKNATEPTFRSVIFFVTNLELRSVTFCDVTDLNLSSFNFSVTATKCMLHNTLRIAFWWTTRVTGLIAMSHDVKKRLCLRLQY